MSKKVTWTAKDYIEYSGEAKTPEHNRHGSISRRGKHKIEVVGMVRPNDRGPINSLLNRPQSVPPKSAQCVFFAIGDLPVTRHKFEVS